MVRALGILACHRVLLVLHPLPTSWHVVAEYNATFLRPQVTPLRQWSLEQAKGLKGIVDQKEVTPDEHPRWKPWRYFWVLKVLNL